jgi:Zn-dependent hydrolases, including glyoxylases
MKSKLILLTMVLVLSIPLHLTADSVGTKQRVVTKLADGVYEIRHKDPPDHYMHGNTVVIIGETDVLVVDSCYLPSTAREDIAQIRQWTNQPVRYLVNTHWHNDHVQGNSTYAAAFPGITIIAQKETAKMMALRVPSYISEYPHRMETFQKEIDTGKDLTGRELTKEEKDDLKNAVAGGKEASEAVSAEFRDLKIKLPDLTFDDQLEINLGNRKVELKYLGRGNTIGDAVVYLPKEKIVVAGDLVDSPIPFFYGGFPIEQAITLRKLLELDFDTLVPGHGDVLKGKAFVQEEIAFIETVVDAMSTEIGRTTADPRTRMEQIKKIVEQNINIEDWRNKFSGGNPDNRDFFDTFSWPGLVEATHAEMWTR